MAPWNISFNEFEAWAMRNGWLQIYTFGSQLTWLTPPGKLVYLEVNDGIVYNVRED